MLLFLLRSLCCFLLLRFCFLQKWKTKHLAIFCSSIFQVFFSGFHCLCSQSGRQLKTLESFNDVWERVGTWTVIKNSSLMKLVCLPPTSSSRKSQKNNDSKLIAEKLAKTIMKNAWELNKCNKSLTKETKIKQAIEESGMKSKCN